VTKARRATVELTRRPGHPSIHVPRPRCDPPALVCVIGSTTLKYHLSAVDELHAWRSPGDWVVLGAADENKPAADGTVEAWGRSATNPVGVVRLRKGYRGDSRCTSSIARSPGLAEVTHDAYNKMPPSKRFGAEPTSS